MASKRLTDIGLATGLTLSDLIHVVITGDTSQDSAGSSYKATLQQVYDAFGYTNVQVTGLTYVGNTLVLSQTNGTSFSANTPMFSGNTSGNCITDLFVSNLNSCSPLHIQNVSNGNVLIGENGGVNVGIGTSSPITKLQVVGGGLQAVYATSTNDIAINGVGTGASSYGIKGESDLGTAIRGNITNTSGVGLDINYTPTNSTLLKVLGTGNVGIRTSSPNATLDIKSPNDSIGSYGIKWDNSGSTRGFNIDNDGSLYLNGRQSIVWANNYSYTAFDIVAQTAQILNVQGGGTGTVCIGTGVADSDTKLHIKGSDSSSSNYGLKVQNSSGTDNLVVRNDGNVGIQTSSPSSNFQVNQSSVGVGLISATGVTTSIWPYSYTGYTLVTGVGTLFSNTLKEGDTIQCTGITLTVAYIISQTSIYCFYNPLAIFGTYVGGTGLPYTLTSGQRFNVTSNGRIGIGTTTPTSNIDIFHGSRGDYTMRVRTKSEELGYKTPFELVTSNQGVANLTMGDPSTVGVGGASITLRGLNPAIHIQGDAASYYPSYVLTNNQGTTVWDNYANFGSGRYGMNFYTYHGFSFITPNYDKRGTVMMVDINNNVTFNGDNIRNSGFEVFGVGSNTEIARFSQSIYPISSSPTGLTTSVGSGGYSAYTMVTTSVGESYFTNNVIPGDTIIVYSANTWPPMYITVNEVVNDNLLYGTHNPIYNYFLGVGLTYYLGGTTRMVVKNNGNVGIGTSTPSSKLHIKGIDSSSSNYGLKVQNSGGTDNLVVRNDGNVGIGTSSPNARLDILGDTTGNLIKVNNNNFLFSDKLRIENNGSFHSSSINAFGAGGIGDFTTNHLNYTLNTSFSTYLSFTNNGNLGNISSYGIIGGDISSADTNFKLTILNSDNSLSNGIKIVSTGSGGVNDGSNYYNYGLNIVNNGIQTNFGSGIFYKIGLNVDVNNGDINYAALFNGGNVGIGTSTPTSTLDINGINGYEQLRLRTPYTPTGSTDTNGNIGDVAWDNNYFYWKTSTQWLRISGQTF